MLFQSTRPGRSATSGLFCALLGVNSFNPRAPGGARLYKLHSSHPFGRCFNPRAPGGARLVTFISWQPSDLFQSTRPGRSATKMSLFPHYAHHVSIHAPRAERDAQRSKHSPPRKLFQSTRPGRSATTYSNDQVISGKVSIHAPRAERDADTSIIQQILAEFQSTRPGRSATSLVCHRSARQWSFNPRAPGGARQSAAYQTMFAVQFQSTRPGRSATASCAI